MKSCIVLLIEYQGTRPHLYLSKALRQRGKSPPSMGVRWPQFSSAKLLENNCNTAGHCLWELWWGFNTAAVFQKKLLAAWSFSWLRPFMSWFWGVSGSQTVQAFLKVICFFSAQMPSPRSADSCIFPLSSDLLCYNAAGSLLLLRTTLSLAGVSRKRWLRDSPGPYRQPWFWERSSYKNVSCCPTQWSTMAQHHWHWISPSCFQPLGLLLLLAPPGLCLLPRLVPRAPKAVSAQAARGFSEQGNAKRSSRCPSCPGQYNFWWSQGPFSCFLSA